MNAFSHFGGWMAIAISLVSGFSMAAEAQVSPRNRASVPVQTPQAAPTDLDSPSDDTPDPSLEAEVSEPDSSTSPSIPMSPSISQVELPFSDVSPDHWAYEALLFLSTGHRQ
jgi:hypothetical protein